MQESHNIYKNMQNQNRSQNLLHHRKNTKIIIGDINIQKYPIKISQTIINDKSNSPL
jgi:hypothetical protein